MELKQPTISEIRSYTKASFLILLSHWLSSRKAQSFIWLGDNFIQLELIWNLFDSHHQL